MNAIGALIVLVLLATGGTALWRTASERTGAVDREDFARSAQTLGNRAREAAFFTALLRRDLLTRSFAKTEREKLLEALGDQAKALKDPVAPDLRAAAARVLDIAEEATRIVKATQPDEGDAAALQAHEERLRALGDEAASFGRTPH